MQSWCCDLQIRVINMMRNLIRAAAGRAEQQAIIIHLHHNTLPASSKSREGYLSDHQGPASTLLVQLWWLNKLMKVRVRCVVHIKLDNPGIYMSLHILKCLFLSTLPAFYLFDNAHSHHCTHHKHFWLIGACYYLTRRLGVSSEWAVCWWHPSWQVPPFSLKSKDVGIAKQVTW